MPKPQCTHKIAVRSEGTMVNAYWTRFETMEGAELVASINREICDRNPEIGQAFLMLAQVMAHAMGESRLGKRVIGVEMTQAPEHEKAGRA